MNLSLLFKNFFILFRFLDLNFALLSSNYISSCLYSGSQMSVDEWCTTVCSMTRSKVKVTSSSKLEILPFSNAISSVIYNGSWQLTTDSLTGAQYLIFYTCFGFCVTWLWTWQKRQLRSVDRQSRTGLIYYYYYHYVKGSESVSGRSEDAACGGWFFRVRLFAWEFPSTRFVD